MFLVGLQRTLVPPIAEREETTPETNEVEEQHDGDDGVEAADDRVIPLDHLSAAECGTQKAVDLLSTVSGHGALKLLTAAQRLVEFSLDPSHAIAAWYIEYGKNSRASRLEGRYAAGTIPAAGHCDRRKPATTKALKAASYRRNVTEWKKDPRTVADRILTGVDPKATMPKAKEMLKFWVSIIEGQDDSAPDPGPTAIG